MRRKKEKINESLKNMRKNSRERVEKRNKFMLFGFDIKKELN